MEAERATLVGLLPRARQVLAENMDPADPDVRHREAVQVLAEPPATPVDADVSRRPKPAERPIRATAIRNRHVCPYRGVSAWRRMEGCLGGHGPRSRRP
ncbi:MAG: hypothetical protein JWO98_3385 [Frankiales bacterium]|nr:hypothetical protein [Frankiales bacterium]